LLNDPELEITDNEVVIKDGSNIVNYKCGKAETIIVPGAEPTLSNPIVSITLQYSSVVQVVKAASVLRLEHFAIVGKDGKLYAEAFDLSEKIKDTYRIEIGETEKTFRVIFEIVNLKLFAADFAVDIFSVKAGEKAIPVAQLKSVSASQDIQYIIALDSKTSF
jgi:hypothetical protein